MNKNFILFDFICGVPHDALMQITRLMFIQYVWNDWSNATKWYEWNCFVIRVGYFSPWSTSYLWRKVFIFCLGCTLNWLTICSEFPDMHYFLHSCSATVAKYRDCRWISHSNFNTKTVTTSFSGPWGRIWISWLLGVKLILSILTFFCKRAGNSVFNTGTLCSVLEGIVRNKRPTLRHKSTAKAHKPCSHANKGNDIHYARCVIHIVNFSLCVRCDRTVCVSFRLHQLEVCFFFC